MAWGTQASGAPPSIVKYSVTPATSNNRATARDGFSSTKAPPASAHDWWAAISVRKPAEFPDLILSVDAGAETTYIISRSQDCLLGGTYQYYNGDTEVDPATGNAILARCARFYPTLADTEIFQHKVGLRPGRDTVRLESEQLSSGQLVIHNYGHGSIGHTLSWGCAADLLRRVQEYL